MTNLETIASVLPTTVLAKEAGRRITGSTGFDLNALPPATRERFLAAQREFVAATKDAMQTAEIARLVQRGALSVA